MSELRAAFPRDCRKGLVSTPYVRSKHIRRNQNWPMVGANSWESMRLNWPWNLGSLMSDSHASISYTGPLVTTAHNLAKPFIRKALEYPSKGLYRLGLWKPVPRFCVCR